MEEYTQLLLDHFMNPNLGSEALLMAIIDYITKYK